MKVTRCQCVYELEPLEAKSKLAGAAFHEPLGIESTMTVCQARTNEAKSRLQHKGSHVEGSRTSVRLRNRFASTAA